MKLYFVIDTNSYAGNFERELCSYVTGQYGDCNVGKDIAEYVKNNKDVEAIRKFIGEESDKYNCYRPAKIYPTPNIYNNGFGFHYKIGEEQIAKKMRPDYVGSEIPLEKYLAYQSVAICLRSMPPEDVIKKMCSRANKFKKIGAANKIKLKIRYCGNFNIIGFRVIKTKMVKSQRILPY